MLTGQHPTTIGRTSCIYLNKGSNLHAFPLSWTKGFALNRRQVNSSGRWCCLASTLSLSVSLALGVSVCAVLPPFLRGHGHVGTLFYIISDVASPDERLLVVHAELNRAEHADEGTSS